VTGPAFTSLATLSVGAVSFDVTRDRIITRTVLADHFGVEFAFTGSPQEWMDFAMRVAREIYEHAGKVTAEQLEGARDVDVAALAKAEIRQTLAAAAVRAEARS
jgi:hypothetical protein